MPCNCPEYTCLEVAPQIFQCGENIVTTLLATETGIWLMKYEFNGRWFGQEISVTNAEVIELPAVFNEHYIHTVQFYNSASELVNDTCYKLDTASIATVATLSPIVPATGSTGQYITVEVETTGETITVPAGKTIWLIFMGNQAWVRDVDFTQSGTTITIINGSTVLAGQILLMMYL